MVREQRQGMNKTHIISTLHESCRERWQAPSSPPPFLVPPLPQWLSQLWLGVTLWLGILLAILCRSLLGDTGDAGSLLRGPLPALLPLTDIPVKIASLEWHKWQKQRKTHKNGDKMLHNDKWKAINVVGWCTPLTHWGAKQSPITHCHQENLEGLTLYLWTMTF